MMNDMKTNEIPPLDARLSLVASFVRPGGIVADVGTDHAYLPIHLLLTGICPRAVATDINEAPLNRAREHAAKYEAMDRISFYRADGVAEIDLAAEGVTDIAICGMGGELIAGILDAAPYTRAAGVRCILQPMSSAEDLRRYLAGAGYRIEDEKLAAAAGKIYTCLAISYDGILRTPSSLEILLGEAHIRRGAAAGEVFAQYLRREYRGVLKKYRGRHAGGLDTAAEEELLRLMETLADKNGVTLTQDKKSEDVL